MTRGGRWCVAVWTAVVLAALVVLPVGLAHVRGAIVQAEGSSSVRATALIARGMPSFGTEQVSLAFDSRTLMADSEPYQQALVAAARAADSVPGTAQVIPVPGAPDRDPHHTYLAVGIDGDADARRQLLPELRSATGRAVAAASHGRVTVALTGATPVFAEQIKADLADLRYAEAVTVPAALLLLVVGLGSLGSALTVLATAAVGVVVSTGALAALALVLDIDSLMVTVATTVGFGLGLDYALLLLLRYRSLRDDGLAPHPATAAATRSAGRAVLWCAAAVMVTSAALLTAPLALARTAALVAALTTAVTAAAATTLLPALLPRLDPLLDRGRVRRRKRANEEDRWARWARRLMDRPWPYLLAALAVLLLAAAPAGALRTGLQMNPSVIADTDAGRGMAQMERDGLADITLIALPHPPDTGPVDTTDLTDALRADPRITTVAALDNGRDLTVVSVTDRITADHPGAERLVTHIRSLAARTLPPGQRAYSTGPAAQLADFHQALRCALYRIVVIVLAGSFLLMLLAFRSVLLPLKAIAMNVLSVAASFGLLVWATGHTAHPIHLAIPLMAATIVFGLSLDYEVFLVHRITTYYRATGDCRLAVARGLGETARPITLAAATMATVFAGLMVTRREDFRQTGFLVATAVILDATLIRMVVVPTLMRLLGHRNWWLPAPLIRLLPPPHDAPAGVPEQRLDADVQPCPDPTAYHRGSRP
ncbi:MMPL family transporter [Streptomyces acidiscabies]|uniref:MMPL family transporter n=1 Tax=Streptomyces acidiscabies TaxID=42234 RepID=UPI00131C07E8|nr:MMPL family transporter [Streptomyces acidiscabies]